MDRIYSAASKLISALPGGLLQTNIAAGMLFAACSGSSLASAATIGSVSYPQVVRRGYNRRIALGSISAGGSLGILIPPSIIFIIYGSLAEVSIGKLFIAGVLPGLLLAFVYSTYIAARAVADPAIAPREAAPTWREAAAALAGLWPIAMIGTVVFGGIYGGVATPTEVAGLAASLAVGVAAIERRLTWAAVRDAALNSVRQTSMILLIVTAAKLLSQTFVYHQSATHLVGWIEGLQLTPMWIVVAVLFVYLVLGLFFEGASMMVITVPFLVPIMQGMDIDLIWFGVLTCIAIEISSVSARPCDSMDPPQPPDTSDKFDSMPRW